MEVSLMVISYNLKRVLAEKPWFFLGSTVKVSGLKGRER